MRNPRASVSDPNTFMTDSGSPIHVTHEARFNGRTLELVETGRENIQDLIDSYAPYTDLNYMLHRLSIGDTSVLTKRQALYGDFSAMPTNPVDAINLVHSAEDAFGRLSVEDKAKYNNDYRVWLASVLGGDNVSNETISADDKKNPVSVDEEVVNEP